MYFLSLDTTENIKDVGSEPAWQSLNIVLALEKEETQTRKIHFYQAVMSLIQQFVILTQKGRN